MLNCQKSPLTWRFLNTYKIQSNEIDDIQKKLHKFQHLCGTIIRTLKERTRPETQLKFYKLMAVPTLLYDSEIWTLEKSRIQAAEMKFLKSVKGCTIPDKKGNEDIRRELKFFCIRDKIQEYR